MHMARGAHMTGRRDVMARCHVMDMGSVHRGVTMLGHDIGGVAVNGAEHGPVLGMDETSIAWAAAMHGTRAAVRIVSWTMIRLCQGRRQSQRGEGNRHDKCPSH
jgi:hypothetical protein